MKVAAVIGATGYVGSHIVATLLKKGYAVRCGTRSIEGAAWLNALGEGVSLHTVQLQADGPPEPGQLDALLEGSSSVYFCAGFETQEPATISFMTNSALATIAAARRMRCGVVCLTSSGGSTNPAGMTNETPKNEVLHWSDPEDQQSKGKYSPAAKTLMEINALKAVGRDQRDAVVDGAAADGSPRLVIINPNLILGPQLKPGAVSGNSLPWMVKIMTGKSMAEKVKRPAKFYTHAPVVGGPLVELHFCIGFQNH